MEKITNKNNLILDLGQQPVSNKYLKKIDEKIRYFDFKIIQNTETGLIKIEKPYPITALKPKFDWITYNEPEKHLNLMVKELLKLNNKNNLNVGGISFKDDTTLDIFNNQGHKTWRLELKNDLNLSKGSGVESIQDKISKINTINIVKKYGKADILVVRHIWEHVYDQKKFIIKLIKLINKNGSILFEIPDCTKLVKNNDYTMPWEEHLFYYTPRTFIKSLNDQNLSVLFSKKIHYPYEDILYAIVRPTKKINNKNLIKFSELGYELNITNNYSKNFINFKKNIKKYLRSNKKKGKIAIFGAGHMAISFLSFFKIDNLVDYVIDNNENKKGLYLPIGRKKIQDDKILKSKKIKLCLLAMNPINHKEVIKKYAFFKNNGGKFISIYSKNIFNG